MLERVVALQVQAQTSRISGPFALLLTKPQLDELKKEALTDFTEASDDHRPPFDKHRGEYAGLLLGNVYVYLEN